MAFASSMVWEVRDTGSDANGGGFDPVSGVPGTDYSQQDAAQVTYTDLAIDGTTSTKCTSSGNAFTSAHVGNVINITSGTGFTVQRVQILSVSAAVATCDKSLGTLSSTGGHGVLGGGLATVGQAGAVHVADNIIYWKRSATAATFSSSNNVAGGRITLVQGSATYTRLIGYDTTRTVLNADANRPTAQPGADGITLITGTQQSLIRNIICQNNASHTSVVGIQAGSYGAVDNCKATGINTCFKFSGGDAVFSNCEATAFTQYGFACPSLLGTCFACTAHDWSGSVNNLAGFATVQKCIECHAFNGAGFGYDMVGQAFEGHGLMANCTADNIAVGFTATGSGFNIRGAYHLLVNCLATSNARYGFETNAAGYGVALVNCAAYNNTTGNVHANLVTNTQVIGQVTPTTSPYIGSGDYSLNGTAGGGPTLKSAGYPVNFPGTSTTPARLNIGAPQNTGVTASSGSVVIQHRRVR